MRIDRPSTRSRTVQTFMGNYTVSGDEHAAHVLATVAVDAVRAGLGDEHPWYVDDRGRAVKQLPRYADLVSPLALSAIAKDGTPIAKRQASEMEQIMSAASNMPYALSELTVPSADALVDPTVKYIAVRTLKEVLAAAAGVVDPTGEIKRAIEAIPNELPSRPRA